MACFQSSWLMASRILLSFRSVRVDILSKVRRTSSSLTISARKGVNAACSILQYEAQDFRGNAPACRNKVSPHGSTQAPRRPWYSRCSHAKVCSSYWNIWFFSSSATRISMLMYKLAFIDFLRNPYVMVHEQGFFWRAYLWREMWEMSNDVCYMPISTFIKDSLLFLYPGRTSLHSIGNAKMKHSLLPVNRQEDQFDNINHTTQYIYTSPTNSMI